MINKSKMFVFLFGVVLIKVHGFDDDILESRSKEIASEIDSMVADVVLEESANNKVDVTGEELTLNREEREAEAGLKKLLKKLVNKSKRNAEPEAQFQTCVGSQCNQNNLGSSFGAFGGFGSAARPLGFGFGGFSGAQQNCLGSQCNQNNVFGKRKREIAEAVDRLATDILNVGAQQNCVGSQCNQNNLFGRRKREIADAVNQLAEDMLVEELNHAVHKEAEGQRKRREIVASILE